MQRGWRLELIALLPAALLPVASYVLNKEKRYKNLVLVRDRIWLVYPLVAAWCNHDLY